MDKEFINNRLFSLRWSSPVSITDMVIEEINKYENSNGFKPKILKVCKMLYDDLELDSMWRMSSEMREKARDARMKGKRLFQLFMGIPIEVIP